MENIENEILRLLKSKDCSEGNLLNTIENSCDIGDINDIYIAINNLIKERKIFLNSRNKYSIITNEHIIGKLESCSKDLKSVKYGRDKIKIKPEDTHTAIVNDLVVIEQKYAGYGEVVGILNRKNKKLVCEVVVRNNKLKLVPFNGNKEIHLICEKDILKNLIEGDRVSITLEEKIDNDNVIVVSNIEKLGHTNDEMNDEIAIAISKDFEIEFSEESLKEVELIPETVIEEDIKNRLDLRDETIFTIDSVTTKDMDDAVSIRKLYNGNYLVSGHIADVSYYIKPGSHLFKEALRRGTSVYLSNKVFPMIPSKLSNGICSLNEDVDRLTKSVIIEVDKKGKVVNYKIVDSVIHSKKKMTYEELDDLFEGKDVDESYYPFYNDINLLRELSNILTLSKHKRGHLNFESSDIKIEKDDDNKPINFNHRKGTESTKIIENIMILINEVVATHFYWQELPFIYRVHNNPDELRLEDTIELINNLGYKNVITKIKNAYGQKAIQNILEDYKDKPEYSIISNLLLRNMSKAKYSTENIGHYALASDNYCHFTSPIRRFPDLMIHTLINSFNGNYNTKKIEVLYKELNSICEHSSYKERQADKAEADYIKLKMAEYMREHINEEFEGYILDIDKENVYIKLDNNIKGVLDFSSSINSAFVLDSYNKQLNSRFSKEKINLGTRVLVKASRVDVPQKEIYFDIKELLKNKTNNNVKKLELTKKD